MYTCLAIGPVPIDLPLPPPPSTLSPVDHARSLTISLLALSPAVLISSALMLLMPLLCILRNGSCADLLKQLTEWYSSPGESSQPPIPYLYHRPTDRSMNSSRRLNSLKRPKYCREK